MEAVQRAVSLLDFKRVESPSRNPETHKRICSLLEQAAEVQPKGTKSKEALSLHISRYALFHLAFPDFAVEMTPHFLDLLTNVEFSRDMNLKKTMEYFPHIFENEHEVRFSGKMDPALEEELAQLTHELTGLRAVFWAIVVNCCQHDLYNLAISHSVADFWLRFNEYLPFLTNAGPSPHTFHFKMTEEEKQLLIQTTAESCLREIIVAKAQTQDIQSTTLTSQQTMEDISPMLHLYVNSVCRHSELLEEAIAST